MTTFTEADHAPNDIITMALLARVVNILQIKKLRNGRQCLEDAGTFRFHTPAQVEVVDFWVRPLKQILVATLVYLIVLLVKHGGHSTWSLVICLMCQAVLFFLDELMLKSFKEQTVLMGEIFHKLLLLVHCRDSSEGFFCDIGACYLHCNLVVGLFHLSHVN